jgi:hypothetical protein
VRGIELVLSGTAKVYCVHDREKRQVNSPDDCVRIARMAGMFVDPHAKFQTCGCCENVFASWDDSPQLCHRCSGVNVHKLGGPINDPIEGVL